jgi:glucose/mannose transport system substrate-binding protein
MLDAKVFCCPPLFAIGQAPLRSETAGEKKLEVFSWWTSGGEAAALNGLFNVYKKQDPGVEVVNATVAGGGGSAARPVLQTRLAGGNPPDGWQTHPGWELLGQYVEPGYCEPINELYKGDGWDNAFLKELVANLMTKDRQIYAVPAGIHHGLSWAIFKEVVAPPPPPAFFRTNEFDIGDFETWGIFDYGSKANS